jgi:hypothetical protein
VDVLSSRWIGLTIIAGCLASAHPALAGKKKGKKKPVAASQTTAPAPSPSTERAPQAEQLRRLQQLVHQPIAPE